MANPGAEQGLIEMREALAAELRRRRLEQGLTQAALASRLGTSQSRVAKMEAGVTLDLLVKGLVALGGSKLDVAKAIIRPMPTRPGP